MKRSLVSGVGVILCAGVLARASIEVKQFNSSEVQVGSTATYSSGAAFSLAIGSTDVRTIVIRSNATDPRSENIGRITVADDTWGNDIKLYVAQRTDLQDIEFYPSSDQPACQNWAGIVDGRDSGTLALKAYIGGDLTGPIGGGCHG